MITTVQQLVDEFGGVRPFADALCLPSIPPVYRAREQNHIPYKWRMKVLQEAKRRRLKVSPELLGIENT